MCKKPCANPPHNAAMVVMKSVYITQLFKSLILYRTIDRAKNEVVISATLAIIDVNPALPVMDQKC